MKVEAGEEYTDLSRQQKQYDTQGHHGSLLREVWLLGVRSKAFIWKGKFVTSRDAQETAVKSGAKHKNLS